MAPVSFTRRRALGAAAAAALGGALAPSPAFARGGPALFELAVDLDAAGARASSGWRTTHVLRAPRRFDLLGLRWSRGTPEAQVRTRRRGGNWSPWLTLHAAGDHAPDGQARPRGTEPAWTNTADELQLRLRGPVKDLRVRFVRAKPTAVGARALSARLRRRATARSAQTQIPVPSVGGLTPPPIIVRRAWGADAVAPRAAPGLGEISLAFVHHTVTANVYGPQDSAAIVLGIARYHRDSNGWNDIGYNFLVDRYGQVFEGRAGGIELAVIGAQAQGYNAVSTGIACLGDFSVQAQSDAGLAALAQLVGWKLALHGVPTEGRVTVTSAGGATNRYRAGTPVTFERISGHRDGDATSCPGNALYAQLPALRAAAALRSVPAQTSGLSLRVRTGRVRVPTLAALSGRLALADGASAAGVTLELTLQPPGAAPEEVGMATCDAAGTWNAEVALERSGVLRARFPGDAVHAEVTSSPVAITVLARLALSLSRRRVRRGSAVKVTGTLVPRPVDGRVLCVLERQVGRRWVVVTRKRINVRGGRYATTLRPRSVGLHRVTLSVTGVSKRQSVRVVR